MNKIKMLVLGSIGAIGSVLVVGVGSAMATAPTFTTPNFDDASGNVQSAITGVLPDALVVGATLLAIYAGWHLFKRFSH